MRHRLLWGYRSSSRPSAKFFRPCSNSGEPFSKMTEERRLNQFDPRVHRNGMPLRFVIKLCRCVRSTKQGWPSEKFVECLRYSHSWMESNLRIGLPRLAFTGLSSVGERTTHEDWQSHYVPVNLDSFYQANHAPSRNSERSVSTSFVNLIQRTSLAAPPQSVNCWMHVSEFPNLLVYLCSAFERLWEEIEAAICGSF